MRNYGFLWHNHPHATLSVALKYYDFQNGPPPNVRNTSIYDIRSVTLTHTVRDTLPHTVRYTRSYPDRNTNAFNSKLFSRLQTLVLDYLIVHGIR